MRRRLALAAGTLILVAGGCAGTHWVKTWTGPHVEGAARLKNILVVGMSSDTTTRRMFEEALAARLLESKVAATASYTVLPRLTLDGEPLKARVREGGYDGVVITRLIGRGNKKQPPSAADTADGAAYGPYWVGYSGWHGEVYTPGYLSSESIVRLQTRLWSAEDGGRALWTGVSDSVGVGNLARACREVSSLVIRDLIKNGLI